MKAPQQALANWNGFYVGGNAGFGWSDPTSHFSWNSAQLNIWNSPLALADYHPRSSGAIGGVQLGYNYQISSMVVGLEADFQLSGIHGSTTTPSTFLPASIDFAHLGIEHSLDWLGTFRGRLGVLGNPSFLVYATGGLAYGSVKAESSWQFDTPPFSHFGASNTTTKVGWTIGGGAEWAINRSWSVKAEYLYYDLGSVEVTAHLDGFPNSAASTIVDQKITGNIARAGLNFHF